MTPQMLPWTWSLDPPILVGIALAAALYAVGVRYSRSMGLTRHLEWWRWVAFGGGLLTILAALESPIDAWSAIYLWAHMVQHLLLLFVAAPLLLLGAPLMPLWRAMPLDARRATLRWLMTHPRPRRAALGLGHLLVLPSVAWALFVVNFTAWHFPVLYDLALGNQNVHDLEHLLYLATGLLFWTQVIPSGAVRPRLGLAARAFYAFGAAVALEPVNLVMVFSTGPLYAHYANVQRPPGAISAMVDQTAAGALMNFVAVVLFGTLFMVLLWWWLYAEERKDAMDGWPGRPAGTEPGSPPREAAW